MQGSYFRPALTRTGIGAPTAVGAGGRLNFQVLSRSTGSETQGPPGRAYQNADDLDLA
ncbi:hypothetical protein ACIBBE_03260 [Streptomyces sp. NPDC051644]|uniref:hypothetical protein n=1 Tax=Streptomyces sp. NPDC051644 TaxID=3365666 RepID=UPI0037AAFDFB